MIRLLTAITLVALLTATVGCALVTKPRSAPADTKSTPVYWYNSQSGILHNSSCRWYGKTVQGYYTNEPIGEDCGICGGAHSLP